MNGRLGPFGSPQAQARIPSKCIQIVAMCNQILTICMDIHEITMEIIAICKEMLAVAVSREIPGGPIIWGGMDLKHVTLRHPSPATKGLGPRLRRSMKWLAFQWLFYVGADRKTLPGDSCPRGGFSNTRSELNFA